MAEKLDVEFFNPSQGL